MYPAGENVVALITGGSDGIGKAIAERLHGDGASVVICGRDPDKLERAVEQIGGSDRRRVLGVRADCRDAGDLVSLYESAVQAFGPVTALVNNVGTSLRGPFLEMTDEQWMQDYDLKVFSAIRLSRLVAGDLIGRSIPGRIVNILAIGGKNPGARSAPTSVHRAAGLALTKVLSKELAPHGILVNAVCIGLVESGQHDKRWRAAGGSRDEFYRTMVEARGVPLGRAGQPSEVAGLVGLLISEEGSYITGTAINVDGGTSASL